MLTSSPAPGTVPSDQFFGSDQSLLASVFVQTSTESSVRFSSGSSEKDVDRRRLRLHCGPREIAG